MNKTHEHIQNECRKILALSGTNPRTIVTPVGGVDAFCKSEGLELIVQNQYGHGGSDRFLATDGDRLVLIRQPCCFGGAWGEDSREDRLYVTEIEEGQIKREFQFPVHETAHHDICPESGIRNIRVVERTFYADRRGRGQVMYESF